MVAPKNAVKRKVLGRSSHFDLSIPNLIDIQLNSYESFIQLKRLEKNEELKNQGLEEIFKEIFPIESNKGTLVLNYQSYFLELEKVQFSPEECIKKGISYAAPLLIRVTLFSKDTGEIRERELYLGDMPLMTGQGTFIINGAERVMVSQIHRSPGVVFEWGGSNRARESLTARIIPYRGSWIEFEIDIRKKCLWVRIDKYSKVLATLFLRVLGLDSREKILHSFYPESEVVNIKKTPSSQIDGRVLYKSVIVQDTEGSVNLSKLAGEKVLVADIDDFLNAGIEELVLIKGMEASDDADALLFNCFEQEMALYQEEGELEPSMETVCKVFGTVLKKNDRYEPDSIQKEILSMFFDSKRYDLGNVGRYKLNKKFNYKKEMKESTLLPEDLIHTLLHLIKLYKGVEKVDDIDHLGNRRVRAVGELVGLEFKKALIRVARNAKEKLSIKERRSDFKIQDLLTIKPILSAIKEFFSSSPLCQFMDQINPLATLTHKRRLNALGPGGLSRERAGFDVRDIHFSHYGRVCPIESPEGPNIGLIMSLTNYARVNEYGFLETPYRRVEGSRATGKIEYLSAMEEDLYVIVQSDARLNPDGTFVEKLVPARKKGDYFTVSPEDVKFMDVSPKQLLSVSTSLIPFLEHDDANRALMGSNMQRQAVPLLKPKPPRVGTGMEFKAAYDSGVVKTAKKEGVVTRVTNSCIEIQTNKGKKDESTEVYPLTKWKRTNQDTCYSQKALVKENQEVQAGEVIADGPATNGGELSLGQNVVVGFLPWNGYNFEDAIVVSERVVQEDIFTSIHLKEFQIEVHETRQGVEIITNDIPNVPERVLSKLDEDGIITLGSSVYANDILVGKISPKAESEIEPEKRLITHVFGEKGKEVRDTSLRLPHGVDGTVIDIRRLNRENGDQLSAGVQEVVRVLVAAKRKLKEGDKMAGRHGNKGVIAKIVPVEDMPYMEDGTPIDICLSPLGVPSRMNIGQLLEAELGLVAHKEDTWFTTPVFESVEIKDIDRFKEAAQIPSSNKITLYDGKTGEALKNDVMVGCLYMLKLHHLVDEKMHARCTGTYSLVTQQPLGGKAQFGGQRLGEMEVWALEAYGAAHTLNEFMTVKSDDLQGRLKIYESIVKGKNYLEKGVPESFRVLMHELRGLGLNITVFGSKGNQVALTDRDEELIAKSEQNF